jgi:hypothetical protein
MEWCLKWCSAECFNKLAPYLAFLWQKLVVVFLLGHGLGAHLPRRSTVSDLEVWVCLQALINCHKNWGLTLIKKVCFIKSEPAGLMMWWGTARAPMLHLFLVTVIRCRLCQYVVTTPATRHSGPLSPLAHPLLVPSMSQVPLDLQLELSGAEH